MTINESNQGFSTFDTMTSLGSLVLLVLIAGPILSHRIKSSNTDAARLEIQNLAAKIPLNEKLSDSDLRPGNSRAPASFDSAASLSNPGIGATDSKDPWGNAYHFHYIKNTMGQPLYLAVWSDGPNAKRETAPAALSISSDGQLNAHFDGDDVGFVRALR